MTGFATATPAPLSVEPHKRVNYTFGLVLGVDEFQQDQLYHAAGRRWHNSLLHGYGTVWGLNVTTPAPADAEPGIRVTAGVAIDPCGREICVPDTMCVRLNGWLDRHRATLRELYPTGTSDIPLAVVLCYRECPDDVVPIPGEPCRTQEDAMQPSRLRDSFELRLALRDEVFWGSPPADNETGLHVYRPEAIEEAAVRAFGQLLARVQLVTVAAPGSGREELLDAVRALADAEEPSLPPGEIVIAHAEAAAAFREAFRVWAVEVRPQLRAASESHPRCGADRHECCVLLAEVDLPVTAAFGIAGTEFSPNEDTRPILLHTRLLQEWLASAPASGGNDDTFATTEIVAVDTVRLWLHYPEPLELTADDITVIVNDGAPAAPLSLTAVAGITNSFDVRLATAPTVGAQVELRIDLTSIEVTGSDVDSLADALHTTEGGFIDRYGDQIRTWTIYPQLIGEYDGDLSGTHPDATVIGLQTRPVADEQPDDGDVLTWDDALPGWRPVAVEPPPPLPPATNDVSGTWPALTVTGLQARPVSEREPLLNHYLRWNGSQWAPHHVGGFVLSPAGRYSIVAAGVFLQDKAVITPVGPVYNQLDVKVSGSLSERYLLHFHEYQVPAGRHTYIVQATLHPKSDEAATLTITAFDDAGIFLQRFGDRVGPAGMLVIEIHRIA